MRASCWRWDVVHTLPSPRAGASMKLQTAGRTEPQRWACARSTPSSRPRRSRGRRGRGPGRGAPAGSSRPTRTCAAARVSSQPRVRGWRPMRLVECTVVDVRHLHPRVRVVGDDPAQRPVRPVGRLERDVEAFEDHVPGHGLPEVEALAYGARRRERLVHGHRRTVAHGAFRHAGCRVGAGRLARERHRPARPPGTSSGLRYFPATLPMNLSV